MHRLIKMTDDRLMIFIDGENLMYGANYFNIRIDFDKLVSFLSGKRTLSGKFYYNSIPSSQDGDMKDKAKIDGQMRFYSYLKRSGFKTTIMPLRNRSFKFKCESCNHVTKIEKPVEKGVDVALVSDMLSLGFDNKYDIATIVSGDSDYCKAIETIKIRGLTVEVAYFKNYGIRSDLIKLADRFINLETALDKIELKK